MPRTHALIATPGARAHVLVAEDDADMRALVVLALRLDGHLVEEVADGLALRESARAGGLDLIVTDVKMPGGSGLDVIDELRRAGGAVPAIVMTAFGDEEAKHHALALGAVLIDKPFTMDDLRAAARELLRRPAEG